MLKLLRYAWFVVMINGFPKQISVKENVSSTSVNRDKSYSAVGKEDLNLLSHDVQSGQRAKRNDSDPNPVEYFRLFAKKFPEEADKVINVAMKGSGGLSSPPVVEELVKEGNIAVVFDDKEAGIIGRAFPEPGAIDTIEDLKNSAARVLNLENHDAIYK